MTWKQRLEPAGHVLLKGPVGKSESVFVTTLDGRFKFKTLRGSEIENLRLFLPHYLAHVSKYPNTLLPRYLGLYTFEPPGNPTKPKRNSTSSVNSSAPTTPSTTTTARDGEEGGSWRIPYDIQQTVYNSTDGQCL
ncbi:hypothetical protein BDR26DRAFT_203870 [Obelidium mucronatum]|nr:hypothetical protein BDR26DRAFT_203870 [Obelidium mucronatum]